MNNQQIFHPMTAQLGIANWFAALWLVERLEEGRNFHHTVVRRCAKKNKWFFCKKTNKESAVNRENVKTSWVVRNKKKRRKKPHKTQTLCKKKRPSHDITKVLSKKKKEKSMSGVEYIVSRQYTYVVKMQGAVIKYVDRDKSKLRVWF